MLTYDCKAELLSKGFGILEVTPGAGRLYAGGSRVDECLIVAQAAVVIWRTRSSVRIGQA